MSSPYRLPVKGNFRDYGSQLQLSVGVQFSIFVTVFFVICVKIQIEKQFLVCAGFDYRQAVLDIHFVSDFCCFVLLASSGFLS